MLRVTHLRVAAAVALVAVALLASGCSKQAADATKLPGPNGGGSTAPGATQPIQMQKD